MEDRRGLSHLCAARSANGVDGWQIDRQPTLLPDPERHPEELWGIEDPRITYVPELEQYAIAFTLLFARRPGRLACAHERFPRLRKTWRNHVAGRQRCSSPAQRINGCWALIHRPMTPLGAHVWISYSPDLRHWGAHKLMLEARRGAWWDANKIGMSPPPIETPEDG